MQEEDLLGAIKVIRPHRFEFSDSVSEALRSSAALEADEEEDRLPDSLSSLPLEVRAANLSMHIRVSKQPSQVQLRSL